MSPEMTRLIRDLGIRYDPEQLKQVLKKRGGEVRMRAVRVSAALAAFLARIVKVRPPCTSQSLRKKSANISAMLPAAVRCYQLLQHAPSSSASRLFVV